MNQQLIEKIVEEVTRQVMDVQNASTLIEVEASARHVHLSQKDLETLFGPNAQLEFVSDLSQPGQFLAKQRVSIKGPKGSIERVAILGPTRSNSQVEISTSDARILGSSPVVRNSGDISNTPGITLCNGDKEIEIEEGLIVAARHIHMDKKDAQRFNVVDNEVVDVQLEGERGLVFNNVLVRVSDDFATRMHIDFDEANACGFKAKSTFAKILK